MAKDDAVETIRRALRHASAEDRTCAMEVVVDSMISNNEFGSIFLWQGILSEAVEEYLARMSRAGRKVCPHCWDNLGGELKERLRGKVSIGSE